MADGRGRTAQEREAARLERERERALRGGGAGTDDEDLLAAGPEPPDHDDQALLGRQQPPPDRDDEAVLGRHEPPPGDQGEDLRGRHEPPLDDEGDDLRGRHEQPPDDGDEDRFGRHEQPPDDGDEDLFGRHEQPPDDGDEDLFGRREQPLDDGDEDLFGRREPPLDDEGDDLRGRHEQPLDDEDDDWLDHRFGPLDPEDDALAPPGEEEPLEIAAGTRRVSRLEHPRQRRPTKRPGRLRMSQRDAPRRKYSRIGRIASLIPLVLGAALIWFLAELFQPFAGSPHGKITVTIPAHYTSSRIGDLLAKEGVISSSFFFELRATLDGERSSMRAGTYHLQLGMTYSKVLSVLTTPPPAAKVTELTISEGQTRAAVDKLLRSQHLRGSYLAATRTSKLLDPHRYGAPRGLRSLEGFLFPSTYQLLDPVEISALVADQLKTFRQRFATVDESYARRRHMTPYKMLIIASLIESETPTRHDRPLVASVIYNRLADGMPLQLDSTTRYATGNLHGALTVSQLNSPSPYNTRVHTGLPPTPIDSPGMASIQAAAHPARTNYLYFFANPCSRGSVFSSNYNQFLALNRRYAAKRC